MKRNIVIVAVTAAAVIGGGSALAFAGGGGGGVAATPSAPASVTVDGLSAGGDDDRDDRDDRDDDVRGDDRDDRAASEGGALTASQAIEAAVKAVPGTVVSVELDSEDDGGEGGDRRVWEVEVLGRGSSSHTVDVDASTGRVLGTHTDDVDDGDDDDADERAGDDD
ncbi:PepSY domain-containing protein [Streptomyces sp. NPDC059866]|uniref:PepSY domain-containing protein n=1 Tax=Streptomyces sp. NPDC059866 TaxID=3346978 RepID=UPI003647D9D2